MTANFKRVFLLLSIALLTFIGGADVLDSQTITITAARTVTINPGQSIQAAVDREPDGTIFYIGAGVHRMQTIRPSNGDSFIGQNGAVLNGSRLLTSFSKEGNYWVASNQTQQGERRYGSQSCLSSAPRCHFPEDLFFNNEPLQHVGRLADVTAGKWFFDYDANKIYIAQNPSGQTVETSVSGAAFFGAASNVTIRNLVIEKYAAPIQKAALDATRGNGWVIDSITARFNHGRGVSLGTNGILRNSLVTRNGQLGMGGEGNNILVENTEISYNNYAGFNGYEDGGVKFGESNNITLRNNYVRHNDGPGIWLDAHSYNSLIEGNYVEYNARNGIYIEISYGITIRNNTSRYNGERHDNWAWGGQITISTSYDNDIYGNIAVVHADYGNGITIINQNRGQPPSYNNEVYNNTIIFEGSHGITGVVTDYNHATFWAEHNNTVNRNIYYVNSQNNRFWQWRDSPRTWSNFRSYGPEKDGVIMSLTQLVGGIIPLPPNSCNGLVQEAEIGRMSGSFRVLADSAASGGAYAAATTGDSSSYAEYCFDVPTSGYYRLAAVVRGPSDGSNSFIVEFGGQNHVWDIPIQNSYTSLHVSDRSISGASIKYLTAGQNIVRFYNREAGSRLDKLTLEVTGANGTNSNNNNCGPMTQEAEAGKRSGGFTVGSESGASGGAYVAATSNAANSYVEYCFTVPTTGQYRLLGTVRGPSDGSNSFFVEFGGQTSLWDVPVRSTYTNDYIAHRGGADPVVRTLSAGSAIVRVYTREEGSRLDKLVLQSANTAARVGFHQGNYDANTAYQWTVPAINQDIQQAEWVNVVFMNEQEQIFADNWYIPSEICLQCSMVLPVEALPGALSNGSYRWWLQTWAGGVASDWSGEGTLSIAMPTPMTPTISHVDTSTGEVIVNFAEDTAAAWYQVYLGTSAQTEVHTAWYTQSDTVCLEGTCQLKLTTYPAAGDYEVYIQSWGPGGYNANNSELWSDPYAFSINTPVPMPATNLAVMTKPEETLFTWDHSTGATWYELWIGSTDFTETYYRIWYKASDLGCMETNQCTLFIPRELVYIGDAAWGIQSWGPAGFSTEWASGPNFQMTE